MSQLYQRTGNLAKSEELDRRAQAIRSTAQVPVVSAASPVTD